MKRGGVTPPLQPFFALVTCLIDNGVVKKTVSDDLVQKIKAIHVTDFSKVVLKTDYNTKIEEIEKKIPNHDKY